MSVEAAVTTESATTALKPEAVSRSASISQIVEAGACIGCGACAVESNGAYKIRFTKYGMYQPVRNPARPFSMEADKTLAGAVCPFSNVAENETELASRIFPDARNEHPAAGLWCSAYVGAVSESSFRDQGSSGGMVSWLLAELLRRGLIDGVVHVAANAPTAEDPTLFKYRLSRTPEEIRAGAKSRYYPIEFSAALEHVRAEPGRYAFVGIPCFVKAVRLLQQTDPMLRERIKVTLGLFCGHLKSAALVKSFARQSGLDPERIAEVNYRVKQTGRRADVYTVGLATREETKQRDWAEMVDGDWGMGFFQYSACNYCDDVMAETADVSFGDAWVKPYSADGRGTNVVVVRAGWIDELLQTALAEKRIEIEAVDGDFLARTQAAGLRQRREGLAYRLHLHQRNFTPRKRVRADSHAGGWKRRRIYALRMTISRWSHPVYFVASKLRAYWIYRCWASTMAAAYRTIYWCDRGRVSQRIKQKLLRRSV
jgi:coenzyme F420-reducing hydrogenase beta subunit